MTTLLIIIAPFVGTAIGASAVLFARQSVSQRLTKILLGFAAGVMVAASVWSLIIPSLELSEALGRHSWMPAALGIILGMLFLLVLDCVVPHQHLSSDSPEGPHSTLGRRQKLMLAVTLHNIPEGMAVGAVVAGAMNDNTEISLAAAIALAIGMAIQNIPEGAIISLPMRSDGMKRSRAFSYGLISGVVEPLAAILMILLYEHISPTLPYLLAFSAGAMLYVVVEELIPETQQGKHSNLGTVAFAIGFVMMMILDVAMG